MPNLQLAIPTLRIASIETSLPFYEALGFEVAWQHQLAPDAPRLTSVKQASVELFLTEHPVAPTGAVVYIVLRDVDALVARAQSQSLDPTFGPQEQPWGDREAYFTDPDANVLRFGQPAAAGDTTS